MTISRAALDNLNEHWAVMAVGPARVSAAHAAASRLYIEKNLGHQLRSEHPVSTEESEALVRDVAFAYEIAAGEGVGELARPTSARSTGPAELAEAAAYRAFELLRALPLELSSVESLIRQVLQLGALAYCSDRWAEFRGWIRDRAVTPEMFVSGEQWDSRVLSDLGQVWLRLLRKNGWKDLEEVARIVARLRDEQTENEELLFAAATHPDQLKATSWRLVALYHWAKLSELVATYLMQGSPGDILSQLDFHFDRALAGAQQSADAAFTVILQWQRAMAHRMISGSLWTITRIGPEIRNVVETATRQRSMFEMLPPQRVAVQEQGLLDPASAAVVVDLPTSSGKTILAEFKIVQAINQFKQDQGWVAYVAPTRALVSQITRRLRKDLGPAAVRVEELTAAVEVDEIEGALLGERTTPFDVLVATPEKLGLVIRNSLVSRPLALLVLDEAHNLEDEDRGIRIELLLATVKRDCPQANFLLLMPNVPNGEDLARWLAPQSGKSISLSTTPWQPNDRLVGLVSVAAPASGRGRQWNLQFEPLITTAPSIHVDGSFLLGDGPQFDETYSAMRTNLGKIAGAASLTLSSRGTSIVICNTLPSVWSVAGELAAELPDDPDADIALVQRFLASEISPEFSLIELLSKRVGVHHSGLSDETKSLMEWLAESGKLRVLVATTGLSQGLNFPVSSILLASRNLPSRRISRPMNAREFWNLAGRAGRVDQDSIGVVALSCKTGDRENLARFVSDKVGALASRLVVLLDELENAGMLLQLERSIYNDQWADFRSYVAHLFAQKKNLDAVLAETELLLRNTFGYSTLAEATPQKRNQGVKLLEATRAYAAELAARVETTTLADSTGFTPEGIRAAMQGMRSMPSELNAEDWQPASLFGDISSSSLPELMKVMLQLPQIRDSISELTGFGEGIGDRAARIAIDWVDGATLQDIAVRYFSNGKGLTASITEATRAIYRNLAYAGTWGISALSKLPTSGIDFAALDPSEVRKINLLGAMLYHGVNTEAGVVMRMSSVPRSVANSLGAEFASQYPAEDMRPDRARDFLRTLGADAWQRHVQNDAVVTGSDLRKVWQVLSGESDSSAVRQSQSSPV